MVRIFILKSFFRGKDEFRCINVFDESIRFGDSIFFGELGNLNKLTKFNKPTNFTKSKLFRRKIDYPDWLDE